MKTNDQLGTFHGPAEVRLLRTLPGPIERVWDYLTDPAKRARWFAGGAMEPKVGGKMSLHFQHKQLAPDEEPPEQYKEVHETGFEMPGTILRWEPPRVLSYTFDEDSDVTFELTPPKARKWCSCSRTVHGGWISLPSPATPVAGILISRS